MFPLSSPQKLIYDMEQYAGGTIAVICGSALFPGDIAPERLTAAIQELFRLNEALRIRIQDEDGLPGQEVFPYEEPCIPIMRFDSEAQLHAYANGYAKEPISLFGPLCEIRAIFVPGRYGLLVKCHHIVGDAWSLTLLASQLAAILAGESPAAFPYSEYVTSEAAYVQSARREKDRSFFLEQFKQCPEATYLSDRPGDSYSAQRATFTISADQASWLLAYAKSHDTSPFVLFLTAFATYFSRVKDNAERFYIGTPVLNRGSFREKHTAGMFINTVPILARIHYDRTFAENLVVMQETALSVFRRQKFHYNDILTAVRQEYGFTEKLYDVVLSYQNAAVSGASRGVETTWYHSGTQTESLQIHIDDRDGVGAFRLHLDYRTDKFTGSEIERMHEYVFNLLNDALYNGDKKIRELNMLPESERNTLLYQFNDTAADYPKDKCVHQLFEEQVQKTPNKIALKFGNTEYTYAALNGMANGIAGKLREMGVDRNDIVALISKRSYYLVVAILGILKAGGAYLPIDYNYPQERIDYIIKDSNCKAIVTFEIDFDSDNVLKLDNSVVSVEQNLQCINIPEDLCAVIYTSGSTGTPKGTLLHHKGIVNYVYANDALYEGGQCNLGFSIYTFDAFFLDVIPPMIRGNMSVLATENEQYRQIEFENLIKHNPKCNLFITPAKLKQFIDGSDNKSFINGINKICIGGEVFPDEFISLFNKDTKVFNVYGPTECSMWALEYLVKDNEVTLGKPLKMFKVYILDKYERLMPIGHVGELCIAGDGVGAGYLNRPELTAEKFIDNPFGPGKLYKTGDLAYWREDGNIVYVGRNDFQVKIRGLRIELGEIESAISGVEGVSQAVVVVRKDETGRQLICAFYTESAPVSLDVIKAAIREKLPRYMMPHIFTRLDSLPLTPSGKVDRKALPEVDLHNISLATKYVPPMGEMEKRLASLMEQVLEYSPVGRDDNFFDLGGDSLKAIEFISKAHSKGIYLALQSVFDHLTVAGLARVIREGDRPTVSYADVDFTNINGILAKNRLEDCAAPQETEIGNLLLAGATGFLGIHILSDFLDHDSGTAYCLVRGEDQMDSESRMAGLLRFYFGEKYIGCDRIRVLRTDLRKEHFGLTEEAYGALCSDVDTVVNAAASVKHYGSYQYFKEANVDTTERLICFCQDSGATLLHISTLSVSGNSFDTFDSYVSEEEKHFYERDLYIGQPLDNVYARSKFEAERAVLEAMARGLRANIFRMGNLTSRLNDGVFQKNYETNAFLKRVKALLELGIIPDYLMLHYVEFTPIDEAAAAIMIIARHFRTEQTVFHINSTKVVHLEKLIEYFAALGYPIQTVSGREFSTALRETAKQPGMEHILESFINDLDEQDRLNYDSNIRIENSFTEEYLRKLGFAWSEIGLEYLRKYVEYFKKIGYWRQQK